MRKSWLETDVIFVEFSNERSHYFSLSTPTGYLLSFVLLLPLFAAQWDKIENNIPNLLEKEQQFMVIIFWKFQYLNSHNDFGLRIKWVYYPNFEFPFRYFDMCLNNLCWRFQNMIFLKQIISKLADLHVLIEKVISEHTQYFGLFKYSILLPHLYSKNMSSIFSVEG